MHGTKNHPFPPPPAHHGESGPASTVHVGGDPYAGLRRHVPRDGELAALGLESVDALVAAINDLLRANRMPPLNRGEFPKSRSAFLRVSRLLRSLPVGRPSPRGEA